MSRPRIEVSVNGEPRRLAAGVTVAGWLEHGDRDPRSLAVERNGEIVPRSEWAETVLADGDRLEVVGFVQGG